MSTISFLVHTTSRVANITSLFSKVLLALGYNSIMNIRQAQLGRLSSTYCTLIASKCLSSILKAQSKVMSDVCNLPAFASPSQVNDKTQNLLIRHERDPRCWSGFFISFSYRHFFHQEIQTSLASSQPSLHLPALKI